MQVSIKGRMLALGTLLVVYLVGVLLLSAVTLYEPKGNTNLPPKVRNPFAFRISRPFFPTDVTVTSCPAADWARKFDRPSRRAAFSSASSFIGRWIWFSSRSSSTSTALSGRRRTTLRTSRYGGRGCCGARGWGIWSRRGTRLRWCRFLGRGTPGWGTCCNKPRVSTKNVLEKLRNTH